jgi:hypothetical protein
MGNLCMQEAEGEEGGEGAGDQRQERRHPGGQLLLEEVWAETHQRLSSPKVRCILRPFRSLHAIALLVIMSINLPCHLVCATLCYTAIL